MFGLSKPKQSSKSKGHRRRNKGRDDQGGNDQGWTEWEYSEDYKREWRSRKGPDGMCI
jgi:hypothetical protein